MMSAVACKLLAATLLLPIAAADCNGNWTGCREQLIQAIFNASQLPSKPRPDWILPDTKFMMSGFAGPGSGPGRVPSPWSNNLTRLVWQLDSPFLSLNATVLYSLNTSGAAAANYPPRAPGGPAPQLYPGGISDTLLLYHNGHETEDCTPNYDGVVDYFNTIGFDVMELDMPLIGCNQAYQYGNPRSHQWFAQWEAKGDFTMRYFIEPVVLAVNYAKTLGYKHIVLLGLSGGGWTTTVAAAVDDRISLSFPVAGSTPKFSSSLYPHWVPDLPEGRGKGEGGGGDYEQERQRPMYNACDFTCMYVLAGLEPDRHQLQILHEYDSCCFAANGLHPEILQYNRFVQQHVGGWMRTAVTAGNYHEVNLRDKVIVASMIEKLRHKSLSRTDFEALPFDIL